MTTLSRGGSSTLSTDSPPFNPRGMNFQSPAMNRSRTNSPLSHSSSGAGGEGDVLSNAVAKHTFQYGRYVAVESTCLLILLSIYTVMM